MPRAPLVAVIGATGTGKSQLAVHIASKYNGEIINGDAMQLYAGLPVITNKVSEKEQNAIPHHLLGCIGLDEPTWTVSTFVSTALLKIQEIRDRGRLPVLVGGTHYYTQSLLFHDALATKSEEPDPHATNTAETWPILNAPLDEVLAKLREVDPIMADRWHPKDHRKIRRSLEIYLQTGRKASDIYQDQRERRGPSEPEAGDPSDGESTSSTMRMDTLILWVHANTSSLSTRLNSRVDSMLASGLLQEVSTLTDYEAEQRRSGRAIDTTSGIWVAIGFKEFLEYQIAARQGKPASELDVLMKVAIERTKIATRQYAKRQVRWIRIKLNHAVSAAGTSGNFYLLDGSDLAAFPENVLGQAEKLVDSFLSDGDMPQPESLSQLAAEMLVQKRSDMSADVGLWSRKECDACGIITVTESDWTQHVKSRRHRRAVAKKKAGSHQDNDDVDHGNGDGKDIEGQSGND